MKTEKHTLPLYINRDDCGPTSILQRAATERAQTWVITLGLD
jgi:hypothetical protein